MNSIKWHGDETIDDMYDHWIQLVEEGNRAGLVKELAYSVNNGDMAHMRCDDGSLAYIGPEYESDGMTIIEIAYGSDADKIIGIVDESEDHEVGENLSV